MFGTAARPAFMPMDAWRDGEVFRIEFDLPGVQADSIDLDVERNVLTVKAERPAQELSWEQIAAERPRGLFSRQLILGDNLDLDKITASLRRRRGGWRFPWPSGPSRARSPSNRRTRSGRSKPEPNR